jgi:hypothetical protein
MDNGADKRVAQERTTTARELYARMPDKYKGRAMNENKHTPTPLNKGECRYMGYRSDLEANLFAFRPLDGTPPYPLSVEIERAHQEYAAAHSALLEALRELQMRAYDAAVNSIPEAHVTLRQELLALCQQARAALTLAGEEEAR